jgi:septation ring formation regulator EzrA
MGGVWAYRYKADESRSIGFIAQEIETIIPEVVSGQEGGKGVAYGLLTPVIVKGIQEQQKLIEQLINENTHLRMEVEELRAHDGQTQIQLSNLEKDLPEIKRMLESSSGPSVGSCRSERK